MKAKVESDSKWLYLRFAGFSRGFGYKLTRRAAGIEPFLWFTRNIDWILLSAVAWNVAWHGLRWTARRSSDLRRTSSRSQLVAQDRRCSCAPRELKSKRTNHLNSFIGLRTASINLRSAEPPSTLVDAIESRRYRLRPSQTKPSSRPISWTLPICSNLSQQRVELWMECRKCRLAIRKLSFRLAISKTYRRMAVSQFRMAIRS